MIGAGHNGLIAAAYLAMSGARVTVFEASDVIGGATRTEEVARGFRASTASYSFSLFRPDIYRDLRLSEHGLRFTPKDPQMVVPMEDGDPFFVWLDPQRTAEELARINPADADGYLDYTAFLGHAVRVLKPYVEAMDPPPLDEVHRQLVDRGESEVFDLAVAGSAAGLCERFFSSDEVRGAFAGQGIIGTAAGPREDGTAWILTYHYLGGELVESAGTWSYVHGGMGEVAMSLVRAAQEAGVAMEAGCEVTKIIVDGGKASAIGLADGREIAFDLVVSSTDPRTALTHLVGTDHLSEAEQEKLSNLRTDGCVVKANLALSELPQIARSGGHGPEYRGTIEISRSIDHLQSAFQDRQTGFSSDPFMEVFIQSANDPSLVDGEGHVVSAFTQWAASGLSGEQARPKILAALDKVFPGIDELIVGEQYLGPAELERDLRLPAGDIFHSSMLPEQSFGSRFGYRTSIESLYLCGSGCWPGGGVMGTPGRNCASVVIGDLGL